MSGPLIPVREAQPLDMLERGAAGGGWDELEKLFKPQLQGAELQPDDDVAKAFWLMFKLGGEGRAVIEWLMDITIRMPFRSIGHSIEETALLAANRQGINGVGEAVLKAIAHGRTLCEKIETQNGAGS